MTDDCECDQQPSSSSLLLDLTLDAPHAFVLVGVSQGRGRVPGACHVRDQGLLRRVTRDDRRVLFAGKGKRLGLLLLSCYSCRLDYVRILSRTPNRLTFLYCTLNS